MTRLPARLLDEALRCDRSSTGRSRARAVELAIKILDCLPEEDPGILRARNAAVALELAQPRPECARRGVA